MEICNLMAIQRDDGLFNVTFYIGNDFHQIFIAPEVFNKAIGDSSERLEEYIYSLFN